jgi:hypothetical protein
MRAFFVLEFLDSWVLFSIPLAVIYGFWLLFLLVYCVSGNWVVMLCFCVMVVVKVRACL